MAISTAFWAEQPRDALQISGPDALTYLQGQVSQDLLPLAVGDSRWSFILQPTGKIDVLARVWRTADETFVLDTDQGFGDVLTARLTRFKIRVKADIESVDRHAVVVRGVATTDGRPALERSGDAVVGWWDRDLDLLRPDRKVVSESDTERRPASQVEEIPQATAAELEAARVESGWPAMGAEIVPGDTIPAETGVASVAVNYKKGCYPGQELVERMDSRRARAPRLLRLLDVAAGSAPGDPVVVDGAEVGLLTSVAGTRALGYVRRNVDLGSTPG